MPPVTCEGPLRPLLDDFRRHDALLGLRRHLVLICKLGGGGRPKAMPKSGPREPSVTWPDTLG